MPAKSPAQTSIRSAPSRYFAMIPTMKSVHLTIEGMTCEHCVRAVDSRLRKTPGVLVERVDIGWADIQYDPAKTNVDALSEVIADEGYTAFAS
jgi:copper chaperone